MIIAPDELTKFAPLSKDKDDKVMVQYTMVEAERAGLLKMDFLGLETLTQIAKTQEYIERTHGAPVDMLTIRAFDDKKTYELFSAGDTDGVFQFESGGMKSLLRKLQPDRFDDLIALNALFRPGPLGAGMGDTYVNRRHGREPVVYMFPDLEPILAPTYGVILYQEQVMQIASLIAGYSLGEADMLRRAMGKKDKAKMAKEKDKFIEQGHPARLRQGQGGRTLRPHRVLRGLRLQQVPLRRLCHGGLRDRLPEGQPPHGVHGGPALHQEPAHGRRREVHPELPGDRHPGAGSGHQRIPAGLHHHRGQPDPLRAGRHQRAGRGGPGRHPGGPA